MALSRTCVIFQNENLCCSGGAFANIDDLESPFGFGRNEGVLAGHGDLEWIVAKSKPLYDDLFNSLEQVGGKLTRAGNNLHISLDMRV